DPPPGAAAAGGRPRRFGAAGPCRRAARGAAGRLGAHGAEFSRRQLRTPHSRILQHRGTPVLPALAGNDEPAPGAAQGRMAGAQGIPADGLVREQARRAGHRPGAGPDPGGERISQVRRQPGRRPRLHAGDAVLDPRDRRRRRHQAVPPADQPALRLRDPAPLHRPRARRPVHGPGPLQRQPRPAAVPERGVCRRQAVGVARPAGAQRRHPPQRAQL
ncbi:MAG: GH23, partial [uncultured Ramlibacter sp.]